MKIESGKSQVLFALMPALLFVAVSGLRVRSVFFFVKHRVRVVLLVPTFFLSQFLRLFISFFDAVCPCVVYHLPLGRYVELLETPLCIGKFHCVVTVWLWCDRCTLFSFCVCRCRSTGELMGFPFV